MKKIFNQKHMCRVTFTESCLGQPGYHALDLFKKYIKTFIYYHDCIILVKKTDWQRETK